MEKRYGWWLVQHPKTSLVMILLVAVVVFIALTIGGGGGSYHDEHGDCPSYQAVC